MFTHDSVAVGEDGATHEPIEHIPSLRLIPNLRVVRPADANETVAAWQYALSQQKNPVALILTRQKLPILEQTADVDSSTIERGAYIISEASQGTPEAILIATGSEVSLAIEAQKKCEEKGISVRVVSMPCREQFEQMSTGYQESVLPSNVRVRVAIEAAHPMGWEKVVGNQGAVIGIDHFGASAPGDRLMKEFGFHVDHVVNTLERQLGKK